MGLFFNIKGITSKDSKKKKPENQETPDTPTVTKELRTILPQALQEDNFLGYESSAGTYWIYSGVSYAPFKVFAKVWIHGNWRWLTPNDSSWSPKWIQLKLPQAQEISAYKIIGGYEPTNKDELDRNPKHITLAGSNDGTNWVVLDEQKNIKQAECLGDERLFILPEKVKYQYYRINVLEIHGPDNWLHSTHIWGLDFLNYEEITC